MTDHDLEPVDPGRVHRAGRGRRWHMHALMSDMDDYLDGHQGRVARLLLALHPAPSLDLIKAALTHDDDEPAIGDMARPAKDELRRHHPEAFAAIMQVGETFRVAMWGGRVGPISAMAEDDFRWLNWCDRLDAYLYAVSRKPHLIDNAGFRSNLGWLIENQPDPSRAWTADDIDGWAWNPARPMSARRMAQCHMGGRCPGIVVVDEWD